MKLTYFDAKRELKKIYGLGLKAVHRKDEKYINFLLFSLDELENALSDKFDLNTFASHILKKEIDGMRFLLTTKLKKKKADDAAFIKLKKKKVEDAAHEKKGPRNL